MAGSTQGAFAAAFILVALSQTGVEGYDRTRAPCPCKNAGICLPTGRGDGSTFCRCNLNKRIGQTFRGASCESQSQECGTRHFCLNGGICVSGGCDCAAGFSGDKCEVNDSSSHATPVSGASSQRAPCPCFNGGQCLVIPDTGRHVCKCKAPWVGASCSVDSNAALVDAPPPPPPPNLGPPCPCAHGGQCVRTVQGKPVCKCRAPWIGASCMVDGDTVAGTVTARVPASSSGGLPGWAVAVIVVGTLGLIVLSAVVGVMVYRERMGHPPFFHPSELKGFQSGKVRSGAGNRKRRFSGGEDVEQAGPYSSHGIPIHVMSTGPEYDSHSMRAEDTFVKARDRGTPLAQHDAERIRLERMMTEIATIVSENDGYDYNSETGSSGEAESAIPRIQRYHEMTLDHSPPNR